MFDLKSAIGYQILNNMTMKPPQNYNSTFMLHDLQKQSQLIYSKLYIRNYIFFSDITFKHRQSITDYSIASYKSGGQLQTGTKRQIISIVYVYMI